MGSDPRKNASQWFYETVFREELIRPRPEAPAQKLPSALRAARSLAAGTGSQWQSRESLFLKQAKLLADYEDDAPYSGRVLHYYPTYESLSDGELRSYFTWRTRLRRGQWEKTSLSFAYLYIYELLNQVGVPDPEAGFRALREFRQKYGQLDPSVNLLLDRWLGDYVIYYDLEPTLLADLPWQTRDGALETLANLEQRTPEQVTQALEVLSPGWLSRSRFYKAHPQDVDRVLHRVLLGVSRHYSQSCKRTMTEQFFGQYREYPLRLFESAVFQHRHSRENREFRANGVRLYCRKEGLWSVYKYSRGDQRSRELDTLIKAVDAAMRERYDYGHPITCQPPAKWLARLIDGEITALLAERAAAKAAKITIDRSRLDRIRRDAAHTRQVLTVEEEDLPDFDPPQPEPEPPVPEGPLDPGEYRLLRSLLYGGDLSWVRREGLMLSVLADSINEKLFDQFADSVLSPEGELIEDYIDDLKEMVQP